MIWLFSIKQAVYFAALLYWNVNNLCLSSAYCYEQAKCQKTAFANMGANIIIYYIGDILMHLWQHNIY